MRPEHRRGPCRREDPDPGAQAPPEAAKARDAGLPWGLRKEPGSTSARVRLPRGTRPLPPQSPRVRPWWPELLACGGDVRAALASNIVVRSVTQAPGSRPPAAGVWRAINI